jgi:hypothetical protein
MTWTYDPTLLQSSGTTASLAKVRRMIGDVDTTWQLLSDEEIYYALSVESSPTIAAAVSCEMVAAGFLRQCNTENSLLRVSAAARHKHYLEMADRLRRGGAGDVPGDVTVYVCDMYVGGAEVSENDTLAADTSRAEPMFKIGEHDNPDIAGSSGYLTNPVD